MDTAILSSRVYQGDPAKPWAEAVAMRDGRVVAVGSNADVKQACGPNAQIFELPGRLVVPGIVDAHLHFVSFGLYLERVDLRDLTSIAACRERVKAAVAKKTPGRVDHRPGLERAHLDRPARAERHATSTTSRRIIR